MNDPESHPAKKDPPVVNTQGGDPQGHGPKSGGRRRRRNGDASAGIMAFVVLVLVVVASGGGTQLWGQGLLLLACGVWVLFTPPAISPTRKVDWLLLLLAGWSLMAFLPERLMGRASWRGRAAREGLDLGWMSTPQPWVSMEAVLLLLGGIMWFYLIWNARINYNTRKQALWFFALGTAVLAVGSYFLRYYGWKQDFQVSLMAFSYFPNKNQTGLFMAMGGVAAFGLMMHQCNCRRWKLALVALACLAACFAGVYGSDSRAALLLVFIGCLLWIMLAMPLHGMLRLLRVVIPVMVVVICSLLLLGRNSLERFRGWFNEGAVQELRLDIYQDTFAMVTKLPAYGLTPGNFQAVFPRFQRHTDVAATILHPESDWLWVMAELGVPGFSLLAVALLVVLARLLPFGDEDGPPYRAAAAAALGIFLLHSMIDVPGHRLGTLLACLVCYRMAVMPLKVERQVLFPPWAFRVLGVVLALTGGAWLASAWLDKPWHSSVAAEQALSQLTRSLEGRGPSLDEATLLASTHARPMDWKLYTQRGRYRLLQLRDTEGAQKDFSVAAFLEPSASEVAYLEGLAWLGFSPRQAALAWREALRRKSPVPQELYGNILHHGGNTPQFARELAALSLQHPDLRYRYLLQRRGRSFDDAVLVERSEDPLFSKFTRAQRASILRHWALHSDGDSLRSHLRRFPACTPYPWFYEGLSRATAGDHERAVTTVQPHLPIPAFPEFVYLSQVDNAELRHRLMLNQEDLVRGTILLHRQVEANDWEGAGETLGLLSRGSALPDYVRYWQGEWLRQRGDYSGAWQAWLPYMESFTNPGQPY